VRLAPDSGRHGSRLARGRLLPPGERLPSALDLASVLKVNRNTVLRALRQLRDEGLLEVRRGRGITVVATPEQGELHARVRELVEFSRRHGSRRDELVDLIRAV
jgi:DNA-binding GntR family transcriptional regulator